MPDVSDVSEPFGSLGRFFPELEIPPFFEETLFGMLAELASTAVPPGTFRASQEGEE